jgi:hypothetical protein
VRAHTYVTINNLHILNLVLSKLVTLIRLLVTLGYNANVGINNVVEFPGFMVLP